MDDLIDDLVRIAQRCERAAKPFDEEPISVIRKNMTDGITSVGRAWSESWLGYQADIYTEGLKPRQPGQVYDAEWGSEDPYGISSRTRGAWCEYAYEAVYEEILRRADNPDLKALSNVIMDAESVFTRCKDELLPTLDALLTVQDDSVMREVRTKIAKMPSHISATDFIHHSMPKQGWSRDSLAIQQGMRTPHHIRVSASLYEKLSYSVQVRELGSQAQYLAIYLQKTKKMKGQSVARTDGPIFIGHGRSGIWKDLREFIEKRLHLDYEEFNREPQAGRSNKERLLEMLDKCCFAFLVMTAEDEQADGTRAVCVFHVA